MIVSHEHRYVFIEVPHTASVAISTELRENYGGQRFLRKHATYRDFLRQATPDQRDYFAFAAVRNPLDLAVSRYYRFKFKQRKFMGNPDWIGKHGSVPQKMDFRVSQWLVRTDASFEQFLLRWYRIPFDSWASPDQAKFSSVIRFEQLQSDFARTLSEIGLTAVRDLPAANTTPGRDRDWLQYYTPKAQHRAIWIFGPYMKRWGYDFPPEWANASVPMTSEACYRLARLIRSIYWNFLRFRDPLHPTKLSKAPFDV